MHSSDRSLFASEGVIRKFTDQDLATEMYCSHSADTRSQQIKMSAVVRFLLAASPGFGKIVVFQKVFT